MFESTRNKEKRKYKGERKFFKVSRRSSKKKNWVGGINSYIPSFLTFIYVKYLCVSKYFIRILYREPC